MKLLTFFMLIGLTSVSAKSYSQLTTLTFNFDNVTVSQVFREIERNSDYILIYNEKTLDINRKVTVKADNDSIDTILDKVFAGTTNSYKISGRQIGISESISTVPVIDTSTYATELQQVAVTGTVTDKDGGPLTGVNVVVTGTTTGAITDLDGNYSINVPPGSKSLTFTFIGMEPQEILIGTLTQINVTMSELAVGLDEVVVIGYGTRSKRDVTTSISSVNTNKIEKVVPSSPELLMQGQMSGVQIIGNQGNPSARPTVRIRGTNTWGISDPLYVIDGIPIKEYGAGIEGAADQWVRGYVNIMASIDPNDIESISVLKDASAGAIYGVRASNGVVLITTKKGKKGIPSVNFSTRFGIQNVTKKLDVLNSKQYADFNNALYASDPASSGSRNVNNYVFDPADPGYLGNSPTYDWQSAVRQKNALTQDYSLNVSGGTDRADYFLSFGYSDQQGVNIDNEMQRYNGSFKLNVNVTDFLRVGINYRLSTQKGKNFSKSPIDAAQMAPWQPIYDPDGINGYAPVVTGYDANGVWTGTVKYGTATSRNDLGYLSLQNSHLSSLRNMGSAYLELEPLKNFKLRGTLNADKFDNTTRGGSQYLASYFQTDGGDPTARGGPSSLGDYGIRSINNLNLITELTASYTRSIGNHNIDILLNTMAQKYSVDVLDAATTYVPTTDPNIAGLGGENKYTLAKSYIQKSALRGSLLRAGYNYANKYYFDMTVRRDGSSRFAPEKRWGVFPGVSAAWRLTKEHFMESLTWLNDLKLRAGWGSLGNQEVQDMAYLSPISEKPTYTWGNNPSNIGRGYPSTSAAVFGMPNHDLTWEKTTTTNIGFDATMLTGLNLSVEYYHKITDGILQNITLPPSAGFITQPAGNVAKVLNKGIELNVNYSKNIGELNISIGANFTTVDNKVVMLYGDIPMGNIEEGYSLFYIKGYKLAGTFKTQEEITNWLTTHNDLSYKVSQIRPGDFYFQDLRGAPGPNDKYYSTKPDGIIDAYDQVYLGKTIPGYFYGFNINLDYKRFDFNVSFTGVGDVQKVNSVKQSLVNLDSEGQQHTTDALNYWTPDNTNTSLSRLIWGDPASNGRFSNFYVENAGYLRLSNAQLGYTLPEIKNVLKSLRVYVGCSNLFTITKFKGFDPEDENHPAPLIMYFGLNARF